MPSYLNIVGQKVKQIDHVKLLGVQIDLNLHFDLYAKELCLKINQQLCFFENTFHSSIEKKLKYS